MGDLWGSWVPAEWILKVLEYVKGFPNTKFFFLTKNPSRYLEFLNEITDNVELGVTIETNRDRGYNTFSKAPSPSSRLKVMGELNWPSKVVVVEPVLDFDLEEFVEALKQVKPSKVYIGYDNYHHRLPEPPLQKAESLVNQLKTFTTVHTKVLRQAWYEKAG